MKKKMNSKKNWFLLLPLFIGVFYLSGNCSQPRQDPDSKESHLLKLVYESSQRFHYGPPVVDDSFSVRAFRDFLNNLDPGKRFYTQADLAQMENYQLLLDDHFKTGTVEFFDLALRLWQQGIARSETHFKEFIAQPMDFSVAEEYELDNDKRNWPENDADMRDYWRKSIKYEKLNRYVQYLADSTNVRTDDSLRIEVEKEVHDLLTNFFERNKEARRSDLFEAYINTFIHLYDPHTDYLNPKEKEDFNINMSGKLEGIGARLQRDREYTKVVSIVPGGPAGRQGELEANDIILSVRQDGQEEVDIKGMLIDDVVSKIRGKKGTKVSLKVRKQGGDVKVITIVRDEVIMDEGFARSAMLRLDGVADKVGFIRLPRFYADFNDPNSPSAARDIAEEITKLKAQGAQSLILDLRNNGGGSLQEVVEMSGLFIPEGPVVQVRDKKGVRPYNDSDSKVHFEGPMVILVNSNSASASEIISACMQDYRRAVIVGGEPTFGKGTVQQFRNLDQLSNSPQFRPLGDMKVTIQKYYRVNGGSVQLKGVEPDILLPDTYSYIPAGEKEYDHPMGYDVIDKLDYKQNTFVVDDLSKLQKQSRERVSGNNLFRLVEENARRLARNREETRVPLSYDAYRMYYMKRREEGRKYDKLFEQPLPGLVCENLPADLDYIRSDSSRIARNEDFLKNLNRDIYVAESIHILRDLNN
jgi:carboxyl-terminal processing protease